jgi:3-hydroxyisobutyrate dehydrogenase-like beta-hydroxyacid dehydrogenase
MAADAAKPKIGFIGLGGMGSRMATRLLDAGYPLHVYNRTRAKGESLRQRGAIVAASPKDLAGACEVIISIVADDAAVENTYFGPDSVLAGAKPGETILEMSTIYPGTSRLLHDAAADKGLAVLDCPVSGSTPQAQSGELVIFAGGDANTLNECRPILMTMGKAVHHMGGPGSGATMKLCVNALMGTTMQALAEAIVLGEKAGLDRALLLDVLSQTTAVSPAQKAKLATAAKNDYTPAFPLRLMFKDFNLVFRQAMESGAPMPATAAAQQIAAMANAADAEEDFSVVIRAMEHWAKA